MELRATLLIHCTLLSTPVESKEEKHARHRTQTGMRRFSVHQLRRFLGGGRSSETKVVSRNEPDGGAGGSSCCRYRGTPLLNGLAQRIQHLVRLAIPRMRQSAGQSAVGSNECRQR